MFNLVSNCRKKACVGNKKAGGHYLTARRNNNQK